MKILFIILLGTLIISCQEASKKEESFKDYLLETGIESNSITISQLSMSETGSVWDEEPTELSSITIDYPFSNLFDGRIDTCFVFRNPYLEWFSIDMFFTKPILIDRIRIFNGYGKSLELYKANTMFKNLDCSLSLWKNKYVFYNDSYGFIHFEKKMDFITINVTNTTNIYNHVSFSFYEYIVQDHKFNDVCISEIEFWYKDHKYNIVNLAEIEAKIPYGTADKWSRKYIYANDSKTN
ncbi:MAG: hypothetical protein HPY53_13340 [Brevinematales bacterium]|nr:hypothetical protein [Brevinematales bacterium]